MSLTRKSLAMVVAEFLGTALLTLAVLSISKSSLGIPYFIASAAGLAVAMATLVFGSISGAHLNPAMTLGMLSIRRIKVVPAIVYICAQVLGGIAAYALFKYFINQTLPTNPTEFHGRILVAEAVGTVIFALGWAAVIYQRYETTKAAAILGLSFMLGMLVSSIGGGGLINPAVAFGLDSWEWGTTVLGPILGAVIGFNLYSLLFAPAQELVADERAAAKASSKK